MTRIARLFGVAALACLPADAADLLDVYRQAQANDPTWLGAQANYTATLETVPQARAGLLPNVALFATTFENRQKLVSPTVNSKFDFTSRSYILELSQPLYNRPNRASYSQALSSAAQAEFDLMLARQDLILRTTGTYLAVLTAREVLEYARSEKAAVQRLLALARRNFNVGSATLIDVHDAQAAYDLAVAQEIAAANDLEVARQSLRVLTGNDVPELATLSQPLALTAPEPSDMEQWVSTAIEQNPAVKVSEQLVEQASQEVEKSRGGHYPTLDFVVARSYGDTISSLSGAPQEATTDQLGIRLQMPLYQGGAINARVRETVARRDAAAQQLEGTKRLVSQQARATYLAVISSVSQVRALDQARVSNQRALESTILGQERGLRNALDVLNNQRTLFLTLRDVARARYNYLLSRLQLQAAAGTLNEEDLLRINRLLH